MLNAPQPIFCNLGNNASLALLYQYTNCTNQNFFHQTINDSDQNLLETKQFESQFGYILGKAVRESMQILHAKFQSKVRYLKNAINQIIYPVGRIFSIIDKTQIEQKLDGEFLDLYKQLEDEIEIAKKKADKNGKPLMILIGENHYSTHSALVQSIILNIAKEKLHMHSILTESFFEKVYTASGRHKGLLSTSKIIEEQAEKMKLTKIPMDYAVCQFITENKPECPIYTPDECKLPVTYDQANSPITREGIFIRNKVMAEVAVHAKVNETVAIVGGGHLQGLIEDTTLKENYEILAINSVYESNIFADMLGLIIEPEIPELNYLVNSDKVLQTEIPSLGFTLDAISNERLVEKAQSIKPKRNIRNLE